MTRKECKYIYVMTYWPSGNLAEVAVSDSVKKSRRQLQKDLRRIKRLVKKDRFRYSNKVFGFISEGDFSQDDIKQCIRTATRIEKVEHDEFEQSVDGCKYITIGQDMLDEPFYTCGKIIRRDDGQEIYYLITAHEQRER